MTDCKLHIELAKVIHLYSEASKALHALLTQEGWVEDEVGHWFKGKDQYLTDEEALMRIIEVEGGKDE